MGYSRPTPVQRCMIPFLLQNESQNVMCLAATGSGKTAAFVLPILQKLQADPYGIYCTILTPTRELAKQIHQQVLAFGTSAYRVQSVLCIGGLDLVHQSCQLDKRPHFCVATPGRLADLLRGPNPPNLNKVRYMVSMRQIDCWQVVPDLNVTLLKYYSIRLKVVTVKRYSSVPP
jgi:ATP-dependent RNA helicase DDX49/DBP8